MVGSLCACERMLGSEVVLGFSPTSQVMSRGRKIKPGSKMIEFKTKMLSRQPETPGGQVFVYSTLYICLKSLGLKRTNQNLTKTNQNQLYLPCF